MQTAILRDFVGETGNDDYLKLRTIMKKLEQIPYENITKKWRIEQNKSFIHTPDELLTGHYEYGFGGTCFSIVYLLKNILDETGISSDFIFADRSYGSNTHCALLVYLDYLYICDPGYFIYQPIKLGTTRLNNEFNDIELKYDHPSGPDLYTIENKRSWKRYSLKLNPVSKDDFMAQWKTSYSWPMMEQNIIMKKRGRKFYYMRDNHLCIKSKGKTVKREISRAEFANYARILGINLDPKLAKVI